MAGLDRHQMILVRNFIDSVFMRMETGDLDHGEGLAMMRTAISNFDPGKHAYAMAFMKDVINAEAQ
jgi:hypothetical protein